MRDDDYTLEESIDELPSSTTPLLTKVPRDAKFISLLPKVLSDQWVIFSLVVLLTFASLLILDIGFGIDIMAEDSKTAGRGGRNEDSTWFLVAFVSMSLIGASITFLVRYLVIRRVHLHGVDIPCRIIDRSKHVYEGMTDVTLQYEYGSQTYTPRISIRVEQLSQLKHIRVNRKMPSEYWVDW